MNAQIVARVMLLLVSLVALYACTTVQTRTHEFCLVSSPILISKQDKLSDTTAKEILEHNKTGAALCGWKPGKL